jgi:hypothetical protein
MNPRILKVLVACEYSGVVRDAFLAQGHDALSCDLLPSESPGPHYQGDVRDLLKSSWDLLICHPPCTYLSVSGIHWNNRGRGWEKTDEALEFVEMLLGADVPHIALENPVSIISSRIRKPDQIIQPHQFGHDASKATCLWLKGLPQLKPTKFVEPQYYCCGLPLDVEAVGMRGCANCEGDKLARPRWGNQTASGQNKLAPGKDRWKIRSRTYAGVAEAMATQWGAHVSRLPA